MNSLFFGFGPVSKQAAALVGSQDFEKRVHFLAYVYNLSPSLVRESLRTSAARRGTNFSG
ncbi:MAG TPA: hypothetical protein VMS08_02135 [Candidatus Saccharimonadia bacterium]|nr:hypothetical protein [Candidatus Saccharimonadia bacterium]